MVLGRTAKRAAALGNIPLGAPIATSFPLASHGLIELIRGYLVLSSPLLMAHANTLLSASRGLLGDKVTNSIIKASFFAHFCGGETADDVQHRVARLRARGVGTILDYAAEAGSNDSHELNFDALQKCVTTVHERDPGGFSAVKFSSIGETGMMTRLGDMMSRHKGYSSIISALPSLKMSPDDEKQILEFQGRAEALARQAVDSGVRLMVDAEQSWFQPVIAGLVHDLSCRYNVDRAHIFDTYQCYLRSTPSTIEHALKQAEANDMFFAAKLVRGAYMESENAKAADKKQESPVWGSKAETDRAFHESIELVLDFIAAGGKAEVIIATHNKDSIDIALEKMRHLRLIDGPYRQRVAFAQLLGLADSITFPLANLGVHVYKYVPYGTVSEAVPYLLRRAQENTSLLQSGRREEKEALAQEIMRRGRALFRQ